MSWSGVQLGVLTATIPAGITTSIVYSKIIITNIVVNIIAKIFIGKQYYVDRGKISLVQVPRLWKFTQMTTIAGTLMIITSLAVLLIYSAYEKLTNTAATGQRAKG